MKIFVIGDFRSNTGPANVTREYLSRLPKGTRYLIGRTKIFRAIEIFLKMSGSDVVLFSGYSKQNLLGLKLAKRKGIKTAYLMHGCVEHENAINECVSTQMSYVERKTLELCDRIYAVSDKFAGWLKTFYPEHSDKIQVVMNGVDDINVEEIQEEEIKPGFIFSIGGGMPRKKIKYICGAIKLLNDKAGTDKYRLVVVGDKGKDDEAINSYPFVTNLGLVDSDRVRGLYRNASLFIQNSCFETFGLSPMEALANGCNVLLSKEIGALDLIKGLDDRDIINNWFDEKEIAEKIEYLSKNGNAGRLTASFNKELYSWETRTKELQERLSELLTEK